MSFKLDASSLQGGRHHNRFYKIVHVPDFLFYKNLSSCIVCIPSLA